jgi:hypothetical protein
LHLSHPTPAHVTGVGWRSTEDAMLAQSRTPTPFRRLLLTIVLVIVGLGLVGFFGMRVYHAYSRFQHAELSAGTTDVEAIRGWMTLPYIARAYGVPEDALFVALGIPKAGNQQLSVRQLVTKYGHDPQATRQAIQQVLRDYQRRLTPTSGRVP